MLAPIVLFVYSRPNLTKRTLEALKKNELASESQLFIFADGEKKGADKKLAANVQEVRRIIRSEQWCKEVIIYESEHNKGLAASIVQGITEIVNKYGKIIVLEDDIVTSPGFLQYMNDALNLYEKEETVMHISGYVPASKGMVKLPETYFLRFMSCWGWATWKNSWDLLISDIGYLHKTLPEQADFNEFNLDNALNQFLQIERNYDGSLNTWAIKWYASIFLKKGLCLYPRRSLVQNIGFDGSGENCIVPDKSYSVDLAPSIHVFPIEIIENKKAKDYLIRFYLDQQGYSCWGRTKLKLKNTSFFKVYHKLRYCNHK